MAAYFRYLTFIPLLIISPLSWASETAPEALVVMVYISTLRCDAQHPKLKKSMDSAYAAWVKRNKKYVDSAKKDKRIPYETCKSYVTRLRNPANDIKNIH